MTQQKVGFCWSEKKGKKFSVPEFFKLFESFGYEFVQIHFDKSIESQGPFVAIIHKLLDQLVKAENGDIEAKRICDEFEEYTTKHPEVVVIDPLENVKKLQDRYRQYRLIEESGLGVTDGVFIPAFVEFTSRDVKENEQKMKMSGVEFPVVCKPSLAHGSSSAHHMALIFGPQGLKDVSPPCVVQSFVCHNAILYKIFVIGNKYFVIERPSLKNFKKGDEETVFFNSHSISKPNCSSLLTELDEGDQVQQRKLEEHKLDRIVNLLRQHLGLELFGVDIIIENENGRYAIIDMNSFPGYDGVDNIFELMVEMVDESVKEMNRNLISPYSGSTGQSSQKSAKLHWNCVQPSFGSSTVNSLSTVNCVCCPVSSVNFCVPVVNLGEKTCPVPSQHENTWHVSNCASCDVSQEDSGIDTSDSSDEKKNKQFCTKPAKKLQCRLSSEVCTKSQTVLKL